MEAPPSPARRGPKPKPHTRENLIRMGARMFHERGYTATGIQDIVVAAGVPKGSFYNYFESKEAFGREVVDHYFNSGLEGLRALLEDQAVPPLERLRRFFEQRTLGFRNASYLRGCLLGNMSLEVADRILPIRDSLAQHFRTWSGLFENCIAEAQANGSLRSPLPAAQLAGFLLNSWEGALVRMRVERDEAPLQDFMAVAFGTLLT